MNLSDLKIRAFPFQTTGQHDYPDSLVRGLSIRVGMRTKTFMLLYGPRHARTRRALGQYDPPRFTLAMAREQAKDLLAAARLSKTERQRTTFDEALETYYKVHLPTLRKQSVRSIRQSIERHFRPTLGKRPIADIKARDIAPLVDRMLDTPTEMRNAFVYLRGFLTWAYKRGYIESVPTARMEAPRKPESRSRVLTRDELAAIWNACPETEYGAIVKLCILSGQRLGQWAAVRREYISGDTITWPGAVMKAGRPMTLPLTPAMGALLPERIGYLLANGNGLPYSNWTKNKRRLDRTSGVTSYVHHDFRRSLATICAEELDIAPHVVECIRSCKWHASCPDL